ncbi:hypothetical protein PR048_030685 [Dryococelus australis]|uniref:Uncharacterized protein n=1 Tax=Dryococelus australis TaxID=614101 RepID=A0ABQ9GA26_9NEOP|nr:hypothetical protein PR048_030685 [Dryococelus australis]
MPDKVASVIVARGASVAERLACSPPTKAIRVQSPFPPPFHSGTAPYSPQSPSSALKTSMLRACSLHSEQHLTTRTLATLLNSILFFERSNRRAAIRRAQLLPTTGVAKHSGGRKLVQAAVKLIDYSPPPGEPGLISGGLLQDLRTWESCLTMPLTGGFSRGSPVFHALVFRCRSILPSITLIGPQDLAVKSRLNLFTHSFVHMGTNRNLHWFIKLKAAITGRYGGANQLPLKPAPLDQKASSLLPPQVRPRREFPRPTLGRRGGGCGRECMRLPAFPLLRVGIRLETATRITLCNPRPYGRRPGLIGVDGFCPRAIDVKHICSEVTFVIGLQFIRTALHASEPIADLQGNTLRIP